MYNALAKRIEKGFATAFDMQPLLVFSPGRINLIGEHIDYNEGFVFPAAIDKGIVVALEKSNTSETTIIAADFEESFHLDLDNLIPIEEGGWRNYAIGVVGELKKMGHTIEPFHMLFGGNLPAGAGLSSSAALENGIVYGLNTLFDLGLSREQMIFISQKAEHNYVGVHCGIMDQFSSMFGKKDHFILLDCRNLKKDLFQIDLQEYTLVLINSNVQHTLSESTYNKRRNLCEKTANLCHKKSLRDVTLNALEAVQQKLSEEEYQMMLYVIEEMERTQKAAAYIQQNKLPALGALLFETHAGLSSQYKVSCEELDFLVSVATQNPHVIGARMMGGGFGGCTINLVKKEGVSSFISETCDAYQQKFGFDCQEINISIANGTHQIMS